MRNINTISHEMGGNKTFKQYILYKLLSWSLHKVDIIVNQCEAMKEDLLKMYNLDYSFKSILTGMSFEVDFN
mgnify:CR=1 FL=1